ncbi:polyphosphate kinase 2 [Limoniibacter endophyticus]|uniref:ADP/GDP-polyphosphate phosphotransferase n=1 Tax=Limoniibacter endophyticus TaxID=1565040 RepID=A0A8J3DV55_9HYPH|nr:polyphosphate kinase 2 [Limoniibacter endophyticus]GHC80368.1 UDP-galactose-lipid carrier transferase [Limoniibacter endophyticus]
MAKQTAKKKPNNGKEKTIVKLKIDGKARRFDITDPSLPDWVKDRQLSAGDYPYSEKLDSKIYEESLESLQIELVKLQSWFQKAGARLMILFEGRDAAGKGGSIGALRQHLNPRSARNVALPKPSETERGQWYFQRYITHFPGHGELVTFDRSWYNRAGVEPVMGFCTAEEHEAFLQEAPKFEELLVRDGIHFYKFWLNVGQETQLKRFHDRFHDPLKKWKFSPIDLEGIGRWDDYTRFRDVMFERTHTEHAPWKIVRANDKRRGRLELIRHILLTIDYEGRDLAVLGKTDEKILLDGSDFMKLSLR